MQPTQPWDQPTLRAVAALFAMSTADLEHELLFPSESTRCEAVTRNGSRCGRGGSQDRPGYGRYFCPQHQTEFERDALSWLEHGAHLRDFERAMQSARDVIEMGKSQYANDEDRRRAAFVREAVSQIFDGLVVKDTISAIKEMWS